MVKLNKQLWRSAAGILASVGVTKIFPDIRDLTLLWASSRKVDRHKLAIKYLVELQECLHEAGMVRGEK